MALIGTQADQVGLFLTGAASDGAAQTNPAAALGNFRSSTRVRSISGRVNRTPIPNVRIIFVSGGTDTGEGLLETPSFDTLRYTAPGESSAGSDVTITNGQTRNIIGSGGSDYVQVTRTDSTAMFGVTVIEAVNVYNHWLGFEDVVNADRAAGEDFYRAAMLRNESSTDSMDHVKFWIGTLGTQRTTNSAQLGAAGSGTITTTGSFADWPTAGWAHVKTSAGATREIVYYTSRTATSLTVPAAGRGLLGTSAAAGAATDTVDAVPGIRIGLEAAVASAVQTIADAETAPTGITWSTATTEATGLEIVTMLPSALWGLWVHLQIPAGAVASPAVTNKVNSSFYGLAA